ncbi:MAG: PTS transporter subunit EIIB [Bacilli bacterium]|nr:PTS transporter subunit EIIB [Bacilli bacterium]
MLKIFDALKDDFNEFLKNNALWMALVLVGIIAVTLFLIFFLNRRKKNTKPVITVASKSAWVDALGGNENILNSEAYGSRLVIKLVDKEKMKRDELKSLGVTSIIEMSDKVTLLLEDKAELVKKELDK